MSATSTAVLAIGELLWDLLPSGPVLGGAPANFANRVCQFGKSVRLVSRVGRDALGNQATAQLAALGLSLDLIQIDPAKPTGTVEVRLSMDGSPTFSIKPEAAYDYLELTPALEAVGGGVELIYFGTLAQRSPVTRTSLYRLLDGLPQIPRFLDINLRPDCFSAETVEASLRRATILKLNQEEANRLSTLLNLQALDALTFCQAIFGRYAVQIILITLGSSGALLVPRAGLPIYQPGIRVKVVDTIGAGDAFAAGFVIRYLEQAAPARCLEFANAMGSASAAVAGGMGAIAAEQLEKLLDSKSERISLPSLEKYRL